MTHSTKGGVSEVVLSASFRELPLGNHFYCDGSCTTVTAFIKLCKSIGPPLPNFCASVSWSSLMMKVAAPLYFHVVRLLIAIFHLQVGRMEAALDGVLAPSAGALRTSAAGKPRWSAAGASRVLGATFALLLMTACGGGWGSLAGQPPVITNQPVNQTVASGQSGTYTVTATGDGPLSYQWYKNGSPISGATSSTYSTGATTGNDTGAIYTVTVTNTAGTVTSTPASLTVTAGSTSVNPTVPVITSQPVNQTVTSGQTASFSVTATANVPLTYQWYDNGVPISGATSSTYTTPATSTTDSGSNFTVTVGDSAGSVTSSPGTLTVNAPPAVAPVITTPPANQTVTAGQTASFSVIATGTGPLMYQWFKNGSAIGGATSSSYTTPATVSGDSGSLFTVTVTNTAGSATGGPATLTVNTPPVITTPPANQTVNVGQTASFSVVASGTAPLTYQWFKNGTAIGGATSSSYMTSATVSGDSGSLFTVTVTNSVGSATGGPATLTVITPPAITTAPIGQTVTSGQTATFSVTASGTGPLTYQWYDNGAPVSGATSSSYTTPPTTGSNSGSIYTVTVTNAGGTVTSPPATLTVNTPPVITTPPANQTVNAGQTASFSVVASGTAPLTYQWFKNGTAIGGATSSSYTTPATVSGDNGALFTVTVTNSAGSATGGPATLTVNSPPAITTPPASQTIIVGQTGSFTVVASGTGPLTYQWYDNGTLIPGATSSSYTTPVTTATGTSQYTVTVTNSIGNATSAPATLTVTLGTPIASSLICSPPAPPYNSAVSIVPTFSGGTAVIGSSGVGSSNITTLAISGSSYQSPLLTSTKTYTLTVTGAASAVASTTCTVTPTNVTITPITPANQTVAPGKQSFNATASGGATDNLTWTASSGTFAGNVWTSPNTAGTYTITATSVDEPSVFVTTTVTVSAPVIVTQPVSQNVCVHSSATLSVVANYAASYQWNFNGTAIPGATSSSYFIASAVAADAGNYTVTVTNPAGSVTSNIAQVVVGSSITSNPVSLSILASQTATFSVAATGEAPFSYQWYVIAPGGSTGTAIAGATSSTYTTPAENTNANGSQFYVTVTDACGVTPLTSTNALLTVIGGNSPPTIITQPVSQTVAVGGTATFTVVAAGTPTLSYQWYQVPAGSAPGTYNKISGATSASYTVPATATNISDDQDGYYVIVTNNYGQAVSVTATLAVGSGIIITKQPVNDYVNAGDPATFSVTATSALPMSYQWYEAPPGSSTFTAIAGATSATYTQPTTAVSDTGSVFYVVVSNGTSTPVTSSSAALFVGAVAGVPNFCSWTTVGDAQTPTSNCAIQLVDHVTFQHGEIVWPNLVSTGNIQLSFTIATSNASSPPADGFALVLGDPSLGATPTSIGAVGLGLGAEGIPGFVLTFDDYYDPPNQSPGFVGDPPIPYLGITRGETALWENQYLNLNTAISPLATPAGTPINNAMNPAPNPPSSTVTNNFTVSLVQGMMTVTMNGVQVFSGSVTVPPVAYMYFTASTGGFDETTVVSNFVATVSAPSN